MRAVVIHSHGGPEVLTLEEVADPIPQAGEALVRVEAVSVNAFLDVSNRAGHVPFARYEFPHILGSEHAGSLVALGPDTSSDLSPGDPVIVSNMVPCRSCEHCNAGNTESCLNEGMIGVTMPGAYAEYSVVPVTNVRRRPDGYSALEAAAMGVNGPLALAQLIEARAEKGSWVLVQAGASSAGTMACVVAERLGCKVIATTRSAEKNQALHDLGIVGHTVDSTSADSLDQIMAITGGRGVDIVIDNIADRDLWKLSMASLTNRGRLVTSGAKFGSVVEINVRDLYTKSRRVLGLRSSNLAANDQFWSMVAAERMTPVIDSVYPLAEAAEAHRRIESNANIGRVMLTID